MKDIKKYVMSNYEFDKAEVNDQMLYKRFMRVFNKIRITVGYDQYEKMLDYYTDEQMGSCYYLMTFICALDSDKRLLNASLSVIDDIVRAIYNYGLNITSYKKYLDIILDLRILNLITQLHNNKRSLNVDPMHTLLTGLDVIDPIKTKEENINELVEYYEEILSSPVQKQTFWFNGIDDFDEIASIVLDKMNQINDFTREVVEYDTFSKKEFAQVDFISKLKYLDLDRQKEILTFFHQVDEEPKDMREKCSIIISTAQSYYRAFGNEQIIYINFLDKQRNR